jgi:hypothetical protein
VTTAWNRTEAERLVSCAPKSYEWAQALAAGLQSAIAEIDRMTADLEHATGPHCSSCGNAIDPDCCWCGTEEKHHHAEEHGFVPMGCDCSRDPCDVDWRKIASNLRRLLWARDATHEADAHEFADNYRAALAEIARLRASRGRARLRSANALRDRDANAARCVELTRRVTELEQQLTGNLVVVKP